MTDTSTQSLRVFLCHSSADKPAVRELYQRLAADGIDAWLDEENLLPGQDWQREIPRAVRQSDVVIVCLSRRSIDKAGYVQKEIKLALDVADEQPEDTIFLIPLKLEECDVPERLSRWQWVNLFDARGYERLMRALRARAGGLGMSIVPILFPPPPPVQRKADDLPASSTSNVQVWGGVEFVRIPAGKFLMGSEDDNQLAEDQEKPQHPVEISYDYWMARYPVTNEQFAAFVEVAPYKLDLEKNWKKKANHPVVLVSWHDAMAYCKWLNDSLRSELGDLVLRLPTEAEWEKAARGEYGNEWPWGNEFDPKKCNGIEGGKGGTTPVGTYSPQGDSPYGVADMAGNVWEWCHSLYQPYPYQVADGRESEDATAGARVVRGGSFNNNQWFARAAYRYRRDPVNRTDNQGFRVVVAPALS